MDAALVEFGAKGFTGASTRAIARRANAHQPQINYHFASKRALWNAALEHLFALLGDAMGGVVVPPRTGRRHDVQALADAFAEGIRCFVRFAAAHPELNRIVVHEATAASERLRWMTKRHVRPFYETVRALWRPLRAAGIAAPIDEKLVHYVLVGAASLPYVNAPEARLLTGAEPTDPAWVEAHADALVATLLPGRTERPRAARREVAFARRRRTK
ncbi:MAG: TetR family transcriptional regulator [Deltaproteobacteria bacterium]|nr:TetR family transcriptional regulator [Deltaproteobacteria bacterium]MBI3388646.1 TetR family transcriptional regulator [Deltaproteobacteria bacterium]